MDSVETAMARLEREDFLSHRIKISAADGTGVTELIELLKGYLVEGPQYFPDDMVTDQPERLICAEPVSYTHLDVYKRQVQFRAAGATGHNI